MPHVENHSIDLASHPAFDNLMAEVGFGNGPNLVISREPGESEFSVAFFRDTEGAMSPSMATPDEPERTSLDHVIDAMNAARASL